MVAIQAQKKIWLDGGLVDWEAATTHVLSHGLHYAYAVFEGIRCHRTPEGTAVFRLREHLERFLASATIYRMKIGYDLEALVRAVVELVHANGDPEAYIRPIAFSGYGEMGLDPTHSKVRVAIGLWPWGAYLGDVGNHHGIRATVSSWTRPDSRALPLQAKGSANYANSALAKMEASAAGYDEAILLNSAGMVAEGPGENIFRVKHGIISTPPASSGILRGITRDTVLELARESGIELNRVDFTREELFTADELFFTGTAAGVTPIREVDGRPVGNGGHPVTKRIQDLYEDAIRGRLPQHRGWLTFTGG